MLKYFFLSYIFVAAMVVVAFGTRGHKSELPPLEIFPDMDQQAKVKYQAKSDFFADGLGERLPVNHTVPMGFEIPKVAVATLGAKPPAYGFANGLDYYSTGKIGDYYGDGLPAEVEVNKELLQRGERQFNINCLICHGASANGKGLTSKFGILTAFNFQQPGALDPANAGAYRPDGAIFDVMTHGKGLMGSYGGNLIVHDRWAIVAYIRSLQTAAKEGNVTVQ